MTSESTPWEIFVARHQVGDEVAVTVTKSLPFGCLIEAEDGVPGLFKGATEPKPGERVRARIEAIDSDLHRISVVSA